MLKYKTIYEQDFFQNLNLILEFQKTTIHLKIGTKLLLTLMTHKRNWMSKQCYKEREEKIV